MKNNSVECKYQPGKLPYHLVHSGKGYTHHQRDSEEYKQAADVIPSWLLGLIKDAPDGVVLSGGALRAFMCGGSYSDVDLFFTSPEALIATRNRLETMGFIQTDSSEWAVTYYKKGYSPVQLIRTTWYTGPDHVIDTFDFVNLQLAFTKSELCIAKDYWRVFDSKLFLHRIKLPVQTMVRVLKYQQKGFTVSAEFVAEFMHESMKLSKEQEATEESYYGNAGSEDGIRIFFPRFDVIKCGLTL